MQYQSGGNDDLIIVEMRVPAAKLRYPFTRGSHEVDRRMLLPSCRCAVERKE